MAKQKKTVPIVFRTWGASRAYRADEPIACTGFECGRTIEVGELYTKHKPKVAYYHYSQHPFCRLCVPFIVSDESEIDSLRTKYWESESGVADEQNFQGKEGHTPVFGDFHFYVNIPTEEEK